jgi:hypothetical protein
MRITLPSSWDGITVGQFQDLYPVLVSESKLVERVPALISVLSGLPLQDVMKIKIEEYRKISKALSFLDTLDTLTDVRDSFKVDGDRYSVDTNISNMCGAQYMDFMHFLGECKGDNNLVMQNLHNLLSCVVIKDERKRWGYKRGEYDGSKIEVTRKLIKDKMPISLAFPIAVFFWNLWQESTKNIQGFGNNQLTKAEDLIKEVGKDLEGFGAGT